MIPHPYAVDAANASELADMDFVFVCIDGGPDKRAIIESLEKAGVPFIDVGMGLYEEGGALGGILRVTTSTPRQRNHVRANDRIAFGGDDEPTNPAATSKSLTSTP